MVDIYFDTYLLVIMMFSVFSIGGCCGVHTTHELDLWG